MKKSISKVNERKELINDFLYNEDTRKLCRLEGQNTFSRDRKIVFSDLLMLVLNNKSKTTSMEIRDYELKLKGSEKVNYTDEAYLKQRRSLNPEVFKAATKLFLNNFYNSDEILTTKGYVITSADGSKYEVPNTPQNREFYGVQKTQHERQPARANTSTLYDLNNNFCLDFVIDKYNASEKTMAKRNIEEALKIIANEKLIVIFDRNYLSLEFLLWLNERQIKYIFRANKICYKTERGSMKTSDELVNIQHTYPRLQNLRTSYSEECQKLEDLKETSVRITNFEIDNKDEVTLVSNLSSDEFKATDLEELYYKRWNIEKSYNCMKNKLLSETFTGNLPIILEQDLYARILIYNQIQDLMNIANKKLKDKSKGRNLKHSYQINENKAIGIFKDEFIRIYLIKDNRKSKQEYERLSTEMSCYVSCVRNDRKTQPRNFNRANKYKTNIKRSY